MERRGKSSFTTRRARRSAAGEGTGHPACAVALSAGVAVLEWVSGLSRVIHDALYDDASQSLCARAWARRDASGFWALWVRIFGERHCRESWRWWNDHKG